MEKVLTLNLEGCEFRYTATIKLHIFPEGYKLPDIVFVYKRDIVVGIHHASKILEKIEHTS